MLCLKENGVDLNAVTGTGPKGIVTKEDVEAFMKKGTVEPETVVTAKSHQPAAAAPQKFKGKHILFT